VGALCEYADRRRPGAGVQGGGGRGGAAGALLQRRPQPTGTGSSRTDTARGARGPTYSPNPYGPLGFDPLVGEGSKSRIQADQRPRRDHNREARVKAAASRRRCIVPANGYFEWERRDGAKVPHYLHGDGVLGMAGLYELWPDPERETDDPQRWVWTITVLTTTASDALGHIHDRSPVVIPPALLRSYDFGDA